MFKLNIYKFCSFEPKWFPTVLHGHIFGLIGLFLFSFSRFWVRKSSKMEEKKKPSNYYYYETTWMYRIRHINMFIQNTELLLNVLSISWQCYLWAIEIVWPVPKLEISTWQKMKLVTVLLNICEINNGN